MSTSQPPVLYVARVVGTDICRIGVSRELPVRMKVLQRHCHRAIELVLADPIHADPDAVLAAFSGRIGDAGTHLRGDWYRIDINGLRHASTLLALEFK